MGIYYVPGTMLGTMCELSNLIFIIILVALYKGENDLSEVRKLAQ